MKTLKNISRILFCFFAFQLVSSNLVAQEGDQYYDLLMLLMDGEYEKVIKKGEKYNDDDDTRRDALPYLYISMANYEASQNPEIAKDFDDPFKTAVKYAGKYYRKDKVLLHYEEHKDFFKKLRAEAKRVAEEYIDKDKESKALYYYTNILKFDPSDYSCLYTLAVNDLMGGDTYGANEQFTVFKAEVAKIKDWGAEPADKKELLEKSMIEHANFMVIKGRKDVAVQVIDELISYVGNNERIDRFRTNNGI